jgi:DNA-binding winged helix-turn-helix (wHTH) protein
MPDNLPRIYDFGPFRLNERERQLLRDGCPLGLTAKAFDTLLVLVQRSGHLVEKQALMDLVWGESFVEEGNVTVIIHTLRKTLGDEEGNRRYIQTVAKRGYRFVAEVHEVPLLGLSQISSPVFEHTTTSPLAWFPARFVPRLV